MKNLYFILALLLTFIAGYLTKGMVSQKTSSDFPIEPSNTSIGKTKDLNTASEHLSAVAQTTINEKDKSATPTINKPALEKQATGLTSLSSTKNNSVSDIEPTATQENKYPNEISDEEIDNLIPAPFNQSLKNRHGEIREKYKFFAASNQQSDWDKNIQNKLSDAILAHPYAKFIHVELLQCKVNFCEIRLFETKDGAWSLIMAEMRLQDWWDIGGSSASGFATDSPSKMGWHVLLPRR